MLILFFDSKGIIHHKYVPEGQIVNATFYIQVLDHLCKRIACVRPEMWKDRKFFLLHDNACPATTAIIQQFWAKKGVAQLSHRPFSPDLTPPPNYFVFPKLKLEPKCDHYVLIKDIQKSATVKLNTSQFLTLCELWNGSKIAPTSVFVRQETTSNKYYLFEFFQRFRNVVAKLTRHTLYNQS